MGELGEEGCRYGDGEERVGQRIPEASVDDHRRTVIGKAIGGSVHDRDGGEGADHDEECRCAKPERLTQGRIVQVDAPTETNAVALESGHLYEHLACNAQGIAYGDDVEGGIGMGGCD